MAQVANDPTASDAAPSPIRHASHQKSNRWALALGSLGVVYGDIGTSPLYAFRVAVTAALEDGPIRRDIVLGVLSLIVWALIVVVAIKYVLLLLRADNNGEGGTLSLTALATRAFGRRTALVFLLGLFAGQSRGTARVASFFAPVMVIWFIAIAVAGLLHIHDDPGVLAAVNP